MNFPFKLLQIPQDKMLSFLSLLAFIGLFALTNHMLERQPERDTQLAGMATLKGHGSLPPLHEAMNRDGELTRMVGVLSARTPTDMFLKRAETDAGVAEILFRWARADMIPEQSFGPYIDARVAGFLQAIGAIPPETIQGTVISAEESARLRETWFRAFEHFRLRLLGQTLGKHVYGGGLVYDIAADTLAKPGPLNEKFILSLNAALQTSNNSGESIRNFLDFIDQTKGFSNLSEDEQDLIMAMEVRPQEHAEAPADSEPYAVKLAPPVGPDRFPPVAPPSSVSAP